MFRPRLGTFILQLVRALIPLLAHHMSFWPAKGTVAFQKFLFSFLIRVSAVVGRRCGPPESELFSQEMAAQSEHSNMIRGVDMTPEMIEEVIKATREAFRTVPTTSDSHERDRAKLLKNKLDASHGSTWHCIIGRDFGSFVSHESKHYLHFYLEDFSVLVFKAG